jgi:hypothetical protein
MREKKKIHSWGTAGEDFYSKYTVIRVYRGKIKHNNSRET